MFRQGYPRWHLALPETAVSVPIDRVNPQKVTLRCNLTCEGGGSMIGCNRNRMLHGP
jgi:hypothetical protein